MSSITHFDIWNEPVYKVGNLIEEIRYVNDTLQNTVCENIVDKLCDEGYKYASALNASAPSSGLQKSIVEKQVEDKKGTVSLSGPQAVYDEFGTGEEGRDNPHPMHDEFGLNPYNSGPHIFYNQFAGRYQWYYKPMAGMPYFTPSGATSGIPSGKQMYNTLLYLRSIKGEIIANEINEAIQTLK